MKFRFSFHSYRQEWWKKNFGGVYFLENFRSRVLTDPLLLVQDFAGVSEGYWRKIMYVLCVNCLFQMAFSFFIYLPKHDIYNRHWHEQNYVLNNFHLIRIVGKIFFIIQNMPKYTSEFVSKIWQRLCPLPAQKKNA